MFKEVGLGACFDQQNMPSIFIKRKAEMYEQRQSTKETPRYPLDVVIYLFKTKHPTAEAWHNAKNGLMRYYRHLLGEQYWDKLHTGSIDSMIFADYKLSETEKAAATEWFDGDIESLLDQINEVILTGYRFNISFDGKNQAVTVSVIGRDEAGPNEGKCMVTRHATVLRAVILALYKHMVIFQGGPWGGQSAENNWG